MKAVDAGDRAKSWSQPGEVHIGTERLQELFAGIGGVLFVDDSYACLRGEDERQLLEACGATRYLKPCKVDPTWEKRRELRGRAGTIGTQSEEHITDYSLRGLDRLLSTLAILDGNGARRKAELLWEALCDLQDRQISVFTGSYQGKYYGQRKTCEFEPSFVEQLNNTAWVPGKDGELQRPEFVVFDILPWKPNPLLLSKIRFKPPIIETLAKEVGIEPGLLDLLKKLGVTSVAELWVRLELKERIEAAGAVVPNAISDRLEKLPGETSEPIPAVSVSVDLSSAGAGGAESSNSNRKGTDERDNTGTEISAGSRTGERSSEAQDAGSERTLASTGRGFFISYVAVGPDEEEHDPDGLDQQARMNLEEKAIQHILQREPRLQRTPAFNPGYDLFEACEEGPPIRWIEVKAMACDLHSRPVGLSRAQFDCARIHGQAYWLYVVEYSADVERVRIVRIQDPAGKSQTFTFDHGWLAVAEVDSKPV